MVASILKRAYGLWWEALAPLDQQRLPPTPNLLVSKNKTRRCQNLVLTFYRQKDTQSASPPPAPPEDTDRSQIQEPAPIT